MRSPFDRRLWILLYWYLLLKCIQPTDQQSIPQKSVGHKVQELADIRIPKDTRVLLEFPSNVDVSGSSSEFQELNDYDVVAPAPASAARISSKDADESRYGMQSRQKQHQHRHQQHNSHGGRQDSAEQTVVGYKANVGHADDSLNESPAVYRHVSHHEMGDTEPSSLKLSTAFHHATTGSPEVSSGSAAGVIPLASVSLTSTVSTTRTAVSAEKLVSEIRFQSDDRTNEVAGQQDDDGQTPGQHYQQQGHNDVAVEFNDINHKNTRGSSEKRFPWNIFQKFTMANIFGSSHKEEVDNSDDSIRTSDRTNVRTDLIRQKTGANIRIRRSNSITSGGGDDSGRNSLSSSINSSSSSDRPSSPKPKTSSSNSVKKTSEVNQSSTVLLAKHKHINSDEIVGTAGHTKSNSDDNSKQNGRISSSSSSSSNSDRGVVSSSSDISQSDIRYNKTLVSDSKPSSPFLISSSQSSSSSSKSAPASALSAPAQSNEAHKSNQASSSLLATKSNDASNPISSLSDTEVSNLSYSGVHLPRDTINDAKLTMNEQIIIIDDGEEFESGRGQGPDDYVLDEPRVLPLRPIIRGPYEDEHDEEMSVVYAEQHTEIKLMCEVDLDIASGVWFKNGQAVHTVDRNSRPTDFRFIRESLGGLTITNVMLEDDGKWQCEAENARGYVENARPVKLVVLDRPKAPYLLIDSRRLDAGNIFVPVKENSELSLACVSEGGNPRPTLTWEVLLSPGVDRHAQKVAAEVLELEEVKSDKGPYKINSGAKSEARLPAVYRAHHNARILCVMEHPTLKMRQNASLLLDVQYTPSFAISRTPGFGYPLREGIEVSLKCDVDSNPPSTPVWQKDDGETPVPQIGDGYLNFTSIRREHSGWYKCTSRHLNFQYSSIGYYLSVRYDSVDVTSEPDDQEVSVAASHNPNKGQLEVQLGGAVTLQCPQGSLGCWSHLDPVTARLRGLGVGVSTPTGQFSLKDVVYQDAGTYKCIGQSPNNKKKLEVLQTVAVQVKGAPTVIARNSTPVAYPGSPLHLSVEFCANPPAYAARWLHGDRVYTPGNQYGIDVLAYGVIDLPTPFCKEARLTYVHMHERVSRLFYFVVSSPGGVAEAMFKVNFTFRHKAMSNSIDEDEEELSEPEEIHFPVFGSSSPSQLYHYRWCYPSMLHQLLTLCTICILINVLL